MDVIITITIPDAKVSEFRTGFLARRPVTLDENGDPVMTDKDWFKFCIIEWAKEECNKGNLKLANENAVISNSLMI